MKISSPPPWPCGRSRRTVVKFSMLGSGFDVNKRVFPSEEILLI